MPKAGITSKPKSKPKSRRKGKVKGKGRRSSLKPSVTPADTPQTETTTPPIEREVARASEPDVGPKSPPPPAPKPEGIAVKVDIPIQKAKPKKRFWIGIMPGAPLAYKTIAGIDFPKMNELVKRNEHNGETIRIPRPGKIVKLDEDQVELIRKRLGDKVVRKAGERTEIRITTAAEYQYDPETDVPLAAYLFMMRADGYKGDSIREERPEAMLQM